MLEQYTCTFKVIYAIIFCAITGWCLHSSEGSYETLSYSYLWFYDMYRCRCKMEISPLPPREQYTPLTIYGHHMWPLLHSAAKFRQNTTHVPKMNLWNKVPYGFVYKFPITCFVPLLLSIATTPATPLCLLHELFPIVSHMSPSRDSGSRSKCAIRSSGMVTSWTEILLKWRTFQCFSF